MNIVEEITSYIHREYAIEPEHPWMKSPSHMTFKVKEEGKWFALILQVKRKTLGLEGEGEVDILNIKADESFIAIASKNKGYLPAYHMNKRHWMSILLDGTIKMEDVFDHIDQSYQMVCDTPSKRIYRAVQKIPRGKVATYGQVAQMAGDKNMARAVGNALHKNPNPEHIPCFRVVNARGELSGAFAFGGEKEQERLLQLEGIEVKDNRVDLSRYGIKLEEDGIE